MTVYALAQISIQDRERYDRYVAGFMPVLAKYARTWKADGRVWHFLTGDLAQVKAVCHTFGLNFWQDEGFLTHSLHTLVIDRHGKLAADFEGNEFTARQLGDYVAAVIAAQ